MYFVIIVHFSTTMFHTFAKNIFNSFQPNYVVPKANNRKEGRQLRDATTYNEGRKNSLGKRIQA